MQKGRDYLPSLLSGLVAVGWRRRKDRRHVEIGADRREGTSITDP